LRHNILLWLDEEGETHRRMLWKRLIIAYPSLLMPLPFSVQSNPVKLFEVLQARKIKGIGGTKATVE
jgi:hypothetical protein